MPEQPTWRTDLSWIVVSEVSLCHGGRSDRTEYFLSWLPGSRENGLLPPVFLYFVKLKSPPEIALPLKEQACNVWACEEHFTFKPFSHTSWSCFGIMEKSLLPIVFRASFSYSGVSSSSRKDSRCFPNADVSGGKMAGGGLWNDHELRFYRGPRQVP